MRRIESKAVILHTFEFDSGELQHFGLESERLDYMDGRARRHLQNAGLPFEGGQIKWWFSYDERPSTLTLAI